jgi:hypothetical protein
MPKLGSSYIEMEPSTRTSIDIEADQWALSTSTTSAVPYCKDRTTPYTKEDEAQFHNSFITVCRNQLKIALYKHTLFSFSGIAQNPSLSHKAVCNASETIQSCSQLQKSTTLYHLQAVHFNFFVLSAVATLYLAIRHAPLVFSDTPREIFTGLEILRPYCTSVRLCERVKALEKAMGRLGYDGMGIGPQLSLNVAPTIHGTLLGVQNDWAEEAEGSEELISFVPRLGSFSYFQSVPQAQAAESCSDTAWLDTITPWRLWENQEWMIS